MYYENYDLQNIVTPVDVSVLTQLLRDSQYEEEKSQFLIQGFTHGFNLGYKGSMRVKLTSNNLRFRGVGNKKILWNKIMKEVKAKRYAGPYENIPFEYYIQSPVGLVPKDGGKNNRLIFHLSHPQGKGTSVNANTPPKLCKVKYPDFLDAVRRYMEEDQNCYISRSDMSAAFRNLGILASQWCLLIMKASSPLDGKYYYFVDKCLPFGASISCSHFQKFSNAVAHIVCHRTGKEVINYLDDYLFAALLKLLCNGQVDEFLQVCSTIKFPVALEKNFWVTTRLMFLGMLLDTVAQTVSIPCDKVIKGKELIQEIMCKWKIMVKQLQRICGFLNFLCRCVVPGRAFVRRLYSFTATKNSSKLKGHHHLRVNQEMCDDLAMWSIFLQHPSAFARPFMDFSKYWHADEIDFYSDASGWIGMGAVCQNDWMYGFWPQKFVNQEEPRERV